MISMIANIGAILGGILFGHFSDKIGRRRDDRHGARSGDLRDSALGVRADRFRCSSPAASRCSSWCRARGASFRCTSTSSRRIRCAGSCPGFAYQCGVAVAGSVAYIEAVFADRMTYAYAMAFTAITVFTLGAIAAWVGRERHGVAFG